MSQAISSSNVTLQANTSIQENSCLSRFCTALIEKLKAIWEGIKNLFIFSSQGRQITPASIAQTQPAATTSSSVISAQTVAVSRTETSTPAATASITTVGNVSEVVTPIEVRLALAQQLLNQGWPLHKYSDQDQLTIAQVGGDGRDRVFRIVLNGDSARPYIVSHHRDPSNYQAIADYIAAPHRFFNSNANLDFHDAVEYFRPPEYVNGGYFSRYLYEVKNHLKGFTPEEIYHLMSTIYSIMKRNGLETTVAIEVGREKVRLLVPRKDGIERVDGHQLFGIPGWGRHHHITRDRVPTTTWGYYALEITEDSTFVKRLESNWIRSANSAIDETYATQQEEKKGI